MTIEDQLKAAILYRYKSIREFAGVAGMAYSTVDSVLKRGITNSGIGTVIKIFSVLDLDMESIPAGTLTKKEPINKKTSPMVGEAEKKLLGLFAQLNDEGREKVLEYADDLATSGKYIKSDPAELGKEA